MSVELIEDIARFDALGDEWDALYRDDPDAHVFLSHRWLGDLYARRPGVCILLWRDAPGEPLGAVLPLRRELVLDRERRRFRGELLMAGNHWADYTGVLCRPGAEERALPALGARLLALPWERLRLDSLRVSDARLARLLAPLDAERHAVERRTPRDNDGETRLDIAPRLRLPAHVDDWYAALGSGTRQRLRRERRRLDADPELAMRTSTAATRADDLAAFRRLWLARWGEAKGESARTKADKYVAILADGLDAGQLRLDVVDAGGRAVALAAVYDDPVHRVRAFYAGARDEGFRAVSAGLLLHARLIEDAIGRGYRVYDFLRGDEDYKRALGGVDETLVNLAVRPTPPTPEQVMLDPCHREAALAAIDGVRGSARASTIGRLFSQLLESWPGEPRVLARYRAWLDTVDAVGRSATDGDGAGEAADGGEAEREGATFRAAT